MNKILTMGAASLIALASMAASTVPASAGGGFGFSMGGGHHGGHNFHHGHHGGIYFDFHDRGHFRTSWRKHVRWCENHYFNYDRDTNLYFNGHRWRKCNSPFI